MNNACSDSRAPYDILPWAEQPFYYPDLDYGPYWGIIDRPGPGADIKEAALTAGSQLQEGTPMVPYAATGPRQSVRPVVFAYNETHNATVFARCTSVFGEVWNDRLL